MAAAEHIIFLLYEALCCCAPLCLCRSVWLLRKSKVAPLQGVCWVCLTWINVATIDQSIKCPIAQALLQSTLQIHLSAHACMELLLIYPIYQFAHSSIYLLIQASRISALTFNPLHPYWFFLSFALMRLTVSLVYMIKHWEWIQCLSFKGLQNHRLTSLNPGNS